ncbi:hypothetical protein JTF08_10185 [Micrococcaceae bacterium RIT802]|jgi:hypothetical protein|nr:hypothetical protein [Micrococcaceae bacterium RIT 802]
MLFTIIGNLVALGAVAALVSAVVKKDRANRDDANPGTGPDAEGRENQGTTAGRSA